MCWFLIGFLSPLCVQVLLALGDYMNVQCHACIGGTNVGEDIRKLDYGQHVVAGTPGRVFGELKTITNRRRCTDCEGTVTVDHCLPAPFTPVNKVCTVVKTWSRLTVTVSQS